MPAETTLRQLILSQKKGVPISAPILHAQESFKTFAEHSIRRMLRKLCSQGYLDQHQPLIVRKVIIHKNHLNGNGGNFTPYPAARTHSCVYVVRKTPRDDWDAIDSVAVRRKAVATAITPQVEGDDFISAAVRERRRT